MLQAIYHATQNMYISRIQLIVMLYADGLLDFIQNILLGYRNSLTNDVIKSGLYLIELLCSSLR